MKEADPYSQIDRLAREAIELQAEFSGALDEHDRRVALIQLRANLANTSWTNMVH
jgi:hypothetical protein